MVHKTDHTALYTAKAGSIQQKVVRKTDHTALYTAKVGSIQQQVVHKTDHRALYTARAYYLGNGKSYSFHIWPVHSEGPSEQKSIKKFRE